MLLNWNDEGEKLINVAHQCIEASQQLKHYEPHSTIVNTTVGTCA